MEIPVIYEIEPSGVNGDLEAVAVHWYCAESCRDKENTLLGDTKIGMTSDYENGTICETCSSLISSE